MSHWKKIPRWAGRVLVLGLLVSGGLGVPGLSAADLGGGAGAGQEAGDPVLVPWKQGGKWGFWNPRAGAWAIAPRYEDVKEFHLGHAAVCALLGDMQNGTLPRQAWGLMDSQGHWIIQPQYEDIDSWDESGVVLAQGGLWGLADLSGQWILKPSLRKVGALREGRFWAWNGRNFGWVDHRGHWSGDEAFLGVQSFSGGLGAFKKAGKWGFVDLHGQVTLQAVWDKVGNFQAMKSGALVAAASRKGNWGLVAADGHWILQPREEKISSLGEGLWKVKKDRLWYLLDGNGHFLQTPGFEEVQDFHDGLGAARDGASGLWGYVDTQGHWMLPAVWKKADDFIQGCGRVKDDTGWHLVDTSGQRLPEPEA